MLKVIVVGYGELAGQILTGIQASRHKTVGFFRWERINLPLWKRIIVDFFNPSEFFTLAKSYNIREIKVKSINSQQFVEHALKLNPDVIIVASWSEILTEDIIRLPRVACVNCHPSLLPKYRGSNPYAEAIRNGEAKTGVTFHLMAKKLDAGEILLQREVPIEENETGFQLRAKCAREARFMVQELLDKLENAQILPEPQNPDEASYYKMLNPDDTSIDWQKSALELHNQIRGLRDWIPCYTIYKKLFLNVAYSRIIDLKNLPEQIEIGKIKINTAEILTDNSETGRILYKNRNNLIVATKDVDKALFIGDLVVYGMGGKYWGSWFLGKIVKVGECLENFY